MHPPKTIPHFHRKYSLLKWRESTKPYKSCQKNMSIYGWYGMKTSYNSQQIVLVTHFTGKQRAGELSQNRSPLKTPQIKFTWGFQGQNSNRYARYSLRYWFIHLWKAIISKDKIRQILYKGSPHENRFGNLKRKNAIIITKKYLNTIGKKLSALAFFTPKSQIKSNNYLFITNVIEVGAMNSLKLIILFILKKFVTEIPQSTMIIVTYCRKPTNTVVRVPLSR